MAFERELIAAMWSVETARAWQMARICADTSDSHLQAALLCFERNCELDEENDNLADLLCVTANELGRLRGCIRTIRIYLISSICLVAIWFWALALAVLK